MPSTTYGVAPSDNQHNDRANVTLCPVVMTAKEVAALLRVAHSTVYKYKDCDGLPAHRFGGAVRFYQHEVLEWMNQSEDRYSALEG